MMCLSPGPVIQTLIFVLLSNLFQVAYGNVEKVIFNGPPPSQILNTSPTFSSLNIHTLTRQSSSVRTNLNRTFISDGQSNQRGQTSWVLLTNLTENQRYEVRVCWSALEPTRFDIEAYTLDTVVQSDVLLQSLNAYRKAQHEDDKRGNLADTYPDITSAILVEIQATADYVTDIKELMANPPPVLVDIILDPFLFNAIPESLLPTIGYLLLLGVTSWFLARWIALRLRSVASLQGNQEKKRN